VPVEGGVEAHDLRKVSEAGRDRLDALQLAGQVQGREGDQPA
jgi:hypothetical protein